MVKGQFFRLFLADTANPASVLGAAKNLSLHISVTVEEATTKDTEGDWVVNEPVAINYDITTSALVESGETITSLAPAKDLSGLLTHYEEEDTLYWQIASVSGANNRAKGGVIAGGQCIITQLTVNAPNRQVATYDAQLSGVGAFTAGS